MFVFLVSSWDIISEWICTLIIDIDIDFKIHAACVSRMFYDSKLFQRYKYIYISHLKRYMINSGDIKLISSFLIKYFLQYNHYMCTFYATITTYIIKIEF